MEYSKTKKLVIMAMMAALAYVAMILIKIPMLVDYLKYDPKDVIIAVTGFLFGPLEALITAAVVCGLEALTVGTTGWIGALMNLLASCSFAVVASIIYRKKHTLGGAVIALVTGVLCLTAVMIAWNYFLTPLYTGMPREAVVPMLPTVFLPFNLIKGGINAALTMMLYKPVVVTLRKSGLAPCPEGSGKAAGKISVIVVSLIVLAALIAAAVLLTNYSAQR